jgi:tRNA G10  N-methylase Trm11
MRLRLIHAHCLDALPEVPELDLIATDPPYAFGGTGDEHALSATVAVALREYAGKLRRGRWMLVMCASSWRSTSYMVEAVRGVVDPIRVAHWKQAGGAHQGQHERLRWASVHVIAFRRGKGADIAPSCHLDHITAPPLTTGRRAELPPEVAAWMIEPFAIAGGTMCDPFAGSGALVKAAATAGMEAIGIEKNPVDARAA